MGEGESGSLTPESSARSGGRRGFIVVRVDNKVYIRSVFPLRPRRERGSAERTRGELSTRKPNRSGDNDGASRPPSARLRPGPVPAVLSRVAGERGSPAPCAASPGSNISDKRIEAVVNVPPSEQWRDPDNRCESSRSVVPRRDFARANAVPSALPRCSSRPGNAVPRCRRCHRGRGPGNAAPSRAGRRRATAG